MSNITYSKLADSDLDEIWDYTAQDRLWQRMKEKLE